MADPAFQSFDDLVEGFMRKRNIPGAALAVAQQGRLVYARGYGLADQAQRIAYEPTNLCRIASCSKPITSAAIMALVEDGKLRLDDAAFPLLRLEPFLEPGAKPDGRLARITVRQILQHTGGWDRDRFYDPMFIPLRIARALKIPSPPRPRDIVRYMMGQPLDFAPGSAYAYSNFGYCVLGRVIEAVSGISYDEFVQKRILTPLGILRMRLARSHAGEAAPNEVHYYDGAGRRARSVFDADRGATVPTPYGAWSVEAMDAHGGWLASVADLLRFGTALDLPDCPILRPASRRALYARPDAPVGYEPDGKPSPAYYALGWQVRPIREGRSNYWHTGKLDGSATLLVRREDGLAWAINFNTESVRGSLAGDIDGPLHGAANAVTAWPRHNLFPAFL